LGDTLPHKQRSCIDRGRSAGRRDTHAVHLDGAKLGEDETFLKDVENWLFVPELSCAIYSTDYRLAPEAPHPAPLEDIYSVFAGLHTNADRLWLDPVRIGIKGESGCGGFAAAVVLYARHWQGRKFVFWHLIYPIIDDRLTVASTYILAFGEFAWSAG
jgi:hypothetical protein